MLTDNEIIEALECCEEKDINAVSCPKCGYCPQLSYFHTVVDREDCRTLLFAKALDLINRQKAEIERLKVDLQAMRGAANSYKMHYDNAQADIEKLNIYCENLEISQKHLLNELATARKKAKSEATKEFVELVKRRSFGLDCGLVVVDVDDIDILAERNGG